MSEKPLKIAMLGHKRIPSREGGVEVVVEELATRMCAQGCEVTCYNRRRHPDPGPKLTAYQGIRLRSVFTIDRRGLAAQTSSFSAAVHAALGRFDVVHFHAEGPCAMLWIPKLFGKRCVATVHGLDHMREKWGRFAKLYILFGEKVAARFADEIIVLSAGVQDYLARTYGRASVMIPNGVNRPTIRPARRITAQYGLSKGSYVLFLGRLVPEKGLRYLIEAFQSVRTEKKLVIAGGASDTREFERELKERAASDPRIMFTGFVQGELLDELYSNAYLYTLPSDLEGMPLSLLEAMSYGNCCLTSDIPECADVVEDHAVTFPHGSVPALRDALQRLCDDPATVQTYQSKAADFICDKYHWDTITDQTLALYRNAR